MRDIIWTIIAIWFLWRIIDAFRSIPSAGRSRANTNTNNDYTSANNSHGTHSSAQANKKGELKPDAGEYVDYEEVK